MKKRGRPKGENNKEVVCTIRIDERTSLRLAQYCELINKTKSEIIRDAINQYIEADFVDLH